MVKVNLEKVLDWIQRGKIRSAKKIGDNWLIPEIEDKPKLGFIPADYSFSNNDPIKSDEFPILSVSDSVIIINDENNKKKYRCFFNNNKTNFHSELLLTKSEVERLEYIIIESGKASIGYSIQFAPNFMKY
jgi:hypothetical protein